MSSTTDATNTADFINLLHSDPSILYRDSSQSKEKLLNILQSTFSSYLKARGGGAAKKRSQVQSLALKGFGLEQIWAQIEHHTSSVNDKLISQLTKLMGDDDFLRNAVVSTDDEEGDQEQAEGDSVDGIDADYGDEQEGSYEFEREDKGKKSKKSKKEDDDDSESDLDMEKRKDGIFDKKESDSDVEAYLDDLENEEMDLDGLKLPSDAEEDDIDDDESGMGLDDYDDEEGFGEGMRDDFEDMNGNEGGKKDKKDESEPEDDDAGEEEIEDVFARANENQEMDVVENLRRQADGQQGTASGGELLNADLVNKIEQIEDEMMNPKPWVLTGEATNKERPLNSLLDVHLDFNAATKLPPTITKEVTVKIEELIKQRVLDELFDDPVLLNENRRKRLNKEGKEMDFTKSKKGLGDMYAEDLANSLLGADPEAFLESQLKGPDAPLKREIEEISKDLFQNLETLSNFHYTPKAPRTEAQIQSQNVPALLLEDAIPIDVSKGKQRTTREVFTVDPLALREKTELTKEEKRRERNSKKRKVKATFKAKATQQKELRREQGIALASKFAVRETERQMEKMKKNQKKGKGAAGGATNQDPENQGRRTNSSSKVFSNLQKIVAEDYKKRDDKREARESGKKKFSSLPTHGQASKRFKL